MEKTPSLETCKKLKEAGFDVKTERVWFQFDFGQPKEPFVLYSKEVEDHRTVLNEGKILAPAPDMDELWQALPRKVGDETVGIYKHPDMPERTWLLYVDVEGFPNIDLSMASEVPAEALAQLWLWVKENHPEALAPSPDLDPRPEDVF